MSRPIHLLDQDADFQTRTLAIALAGSSIHTVGPGGTFRDACSAARCIKRQRGIVHAWGTQSLIAAAVANAGPIVFTPSPEICRTTAGRLLRLSKRRDLTIICPTDSLRAALCEIGLAPDKCRLIAPGATLPHASAATRQSLGLSKVDFVLLAPGESTRAAAHDLALATTAIVHELDSTWKLLIWGRGPLADQLRRSGWRLNHPELLYFAPHLDFADLPPLADAAILTTRPSAATLPAALCMAGGLPMVYSSPDRSPLKLAQELMVLRADPARQKALGQTAAIQAANRFSAARFSQMHNALYAELAAVTHPDS